MPQKSNPKPENSNPKLAKNNPKPEIDTQNPIKVT